MYQILILTLPVVTPSSFLAKIAQIAQEVIVFFPEKREEIELWFWQIWTAQWLKFFLDYCVFFRPFSTKTRILQNNFKQYFCLLEYYLWKFWKIWTIFKGVRTQKPPRKGHYMDPESLRFFNLTIANATLMKPTTICIFIRV